MGLRKRKLVLVIAILICIFIVPMVITVDVVCYRWPKLCCEFDDVDINTGRTRRTRYLLYCKIREKIEDSLLTKTIGQFPDGVQPDWQRVYTNLFQIVNRVHIHHGYGSAIGQIQEVDVIWQLYAFSDEAKRHLVQTVLDKWQSDGGYFGVDVYLANVSTMAEQKKKSDPNVIISVSDLILTQDI
ncbi:MAG: hypothetical protein ACYS9C_05140 [Planctomycetota bacterium]|jgi:hypothetical protein